MRYERLIAGLKTIAAFLYNLTGKTWQFLQVSGRKILRLLITCSVRCRDIIRVCWPIIRGHLWNYVILTRLHKPIGILLLLWPTLIALWIAAGGIPNLQILVIFILGVIIMRSAGCVINDFADRNLDGQVLRTRERPLPAGMVSVTEVLSVFIFLVLCAGLLVLQLDPLTVKLSLIGILLAVIYPFTKRYTYMPQLFLGMAFGWAVPMAFSAQTGNLPVVCWVLFMTVVLWALVYDTMYAMVDKADDLKMGMKSTAILFEDAVQEIIGIIQILVLLGFIIIGGREELNWMYFTGVGVGTLFFIYQQYLIKDKKRDKCFKAFLNNNWFGASVFTGLFCSYQFG